MYGVESATHVEGAVYAVPESNGSLPQSVQSVEGESRDPLAEGALALARESVKQGLESQGFVDVTGGNLGNFQTFLDRDPTVMEMEDLKPGLLSELASWVSDQIQANAEATSDVQANIDPEAAVKLLA